VAREGGAPPAGRRLSNASGGVLGGRGQRARREGEREQDKDGAHTATFPLQPQPFGRHTTVFCVPHAAKALAARGLEGTQTSLLGKLGALSPAGVRQQRSAEGLLTAWSTLPWSTVPGYALQEFP
jgi:hypothetical protein